MQCQSTLATGASGAPTASRAQIRRRIAAPIDEQQRLIALRQVRGDRLAQWVAQSVLEFQPANVDQLDSGRFRGARSCGQAQMAEATALRVVQRFQRGRGSTHDQRDAEQLRALGREIPRGISEPILLLERAVVFFVDHDQSKLCERHEDRAARADQYTNVSVATLQPRLCALAFGETGVIHRGAPEPMRESFERLRSQRDFGDQHQRLSRPPPERTRSPAGRFRFCRCRLRRRAACTRNDPARARADFDRRSLFIGQLERDLATETV